MEFKQGFSIIICTHNGEKKLPETLTHLAALQLPEHLPVEILLVNNASTDKTKELFYEWWQKLNSPFIFNVMDEPRAGKGYAIETGYDAAQFSYLITVDDDNWLRKDYLCNAIKLIEQHPDAGIFQAGNQPVFESLTIPDWVEPLKHYLVIGNPVEQEGYFKKDYYGVWGAGMIIRKDDWQRIRNLGFSALTSKIPGKAAGEDIELAFAVLLLGRKIYFSETLHYGHYMPAARINWKTLEKNFKTFGYTDYYFQLYAMVFDAYAKNYTITASRLRLRLIKHWLRLMKSRGIRSNIAYFFKRGDRMHRLLITQYYAFLYWFITLSGKGVTDMRFIQSWMNPLLQNNPNNFRI